MPSEGDGLVVLAGIWAVTPYAPLADVALFRDSLKQTCLMNAPYQDVRLKAPVVRVEPGTRYTPSPEFERPPALTGRGGRSGSRLGFALRGRILVCSGSAMVVLQRSKGALNGESELTGSTPCFGQMGITDVRVSTG